MSGFRLVQGGMAVDRRVPVTFHWNGETLHGLAGDTIASALLANGRMLVARSFKYHRPRGVVGIDAVETNALMQIGHDGLSTPNVLATDTMIYPGLRARSVNCWPSLEIDIMSINDRLKSLLGAGFYYKTFMWPSWRLFEPFIRRAAGLGCAPDRADVEQYDIRHLDVETLIVGTGSGYLEVLREAQGRTILIDRKNLSPIANVKTLGHTTVIAHLDHNLILAVETLPGSPRAGRVAERLWKIRAKAVNYATGYREQPLIFANNDRPGIMLASAVEAYITRYGVAPGKRILISTHSDEGHKLARLCTEVGLDVAGIVDCRPAPGFPAIKGHIVRAIGGRRLRAAEIATAGGRQIVGCDVIAMSGGFSPAIQLFLQGGGKMTGDAGDGVAPCRTRFVSSRPVANINRIPEIVLDDHRLSRSSFVDFQTDVTLFDIKQAVRENYASPDHLKRYTVLGMGVDQGRLSSANGVQALAYYRDIPPDQVFPTKSRPPVIPTKLGVLSAGRPAGELWRPRRHLPAHDLHVRLSAVFEDLGWERPVYYSRGGEKLAEAAMREAMTVRQTAGLFDGSSLGKFELKGPEAGAFLDHFYVGSMSTLPIGQIRYGLMLNENGSVIDDGVCMRLLDDHFLVNASSRNADRIYAIMQEYHQREWRYNFVMQNVTSAWGTLSLAGPKARAILSAAGTDIDVSPHAFGHLRVRTGVVAGLPARVARVSFSGETCYELSVPAHMTTTLADAVLSAGMPFGLIPYGIEALDILRTEKGYIHVGVDTDSETQPDDIGFGACIAKKKVDFIGRRSLTRLASLDDTRRRLVGLLHQDPNIVLPAGSHIVNAQDRSNGFVSSSHFSPTLKHGVAMAMIENGRARYGEEVSVFSRGKRWTATVTKPVFFDADGSRLHG